MVAQVVGAIVGGIVGALVAATLTADLRETDIGQTAAIEALFVVMFAAAGWFLAGMVQ